VSNIQQDSQIETQVDITSNIGGHKKGSAKQMKKENNLKLAEVISTFT
jgi:hypothetical protein